MRIQDLITSNAGTLFISMIPLFHAQLEAATEHMLFRGTDLTLKTNVRRNLAARVGYINLVFAVIVVSLDSVFAIMFAEWASNDCKILSVILFLLVSVYAFKLVGDGYSGFRNSARTSRERRLFTTFLPLLITLARGVAEIASQS